MYISLCMYAASQTGGCSDIPYSIHAQVYIQMLLTDSECARFQDCDQPAQLPRIQTDEFQVVGSKRTANFIPASPFLPCTASAELTKPGIVLLEILRSTFPSLATSTSTKPRSKYYSTTAALPRPSTMHHYSSHCKTLSKALAKSWHRDPPLAPQSPIS